MSGGPVRRPLDAKPWAGRSWTYNRRPPANWAQVFEARSALRRPVQHQTETCGSTAPVSGLRRTRERLR
eukprot:11500503-Heterocapsa_arctica.AAC.1